MVRVPTRKARRGEGCKCLWKAVVIRSGSHTHGRPYCICSIIKSDCPGWGCSDIRCCVHNQAEFNRIPSNSYLSASIDDCRWCLLGDGQRTRTRTGIEARTAGVAGRKGVRARIGRKALVLGVSLAVELKWTSGECRPVRCQGHSPGRYSISRGAGNIDSWNHMVRAVNRRCAGGGGYQM